MPALVTCIIPCRNEAASIEGAIDSILAQDYPLENIEVVVVDGCSDDNTAELAKRRLDGHHLRRYDIVLNPDARTPSNLNRGLLWADGEYIVRVDARSRIPANYISTTIAALQTNDYSVVGGRQLARPAVAGLEARSIARALNNKYAMGGSRYRRPGAETGPCDTAYLGVFRTAQLRDTGGWSEEFATNQDFELNQRMADYGPVWFLAGIPVDYHPRPTFRQLFAQYHRFGQWKVVYWQTTGDRPQPRQLALVVVPAVSAAAGLTLLALRPRLATPAAAAVVLGGLAVDHLGTDGPDVSPLGRCVAAAATGTVGLAWWTGVARGLVKQLLR